jgi:DNA-binding CsgD family transcriptional regulator
VPQAVRYCQPGRATGMPTDQPLTTFIGRERETARVRERLRRADVRLVTLTGPGGAGKTRLALKAAAGLNTDFADGTVFYVWRRHLEPPARSPRCRRSSPARVVFRRRALLSGDKRSNRAIASELVIAEGTAAIHVAHILNKLGFDSRSQIAAWVVENQISNRLRDRNASLPRYPQRTIRSDTRDACGEPRARSGCPEPTWRALPQVLVRCRDWQDLLFVGSPSKEKAIAVHHQAEGDAGLPDENLRSPGVRVARTITIPIDGRA